MTWVIILRQGCVRCRPAFSPSASLVSGAGLELDQPIFLLEALTEGAPGSND